METHGALPQRFGCVRSTLLQPRYGHVSNRDVGRMWRNNEGEGGCGWHQGFLNPKLYDSSLPKRMIRSYLLASPPHQTRVKNVIPWKIERTTFSLPGPGTWTERERDAQGRDGGGRGKVEFLCRPRRNGSSSFRILGHSIEEGSRLPCSRVCQHRIMNMLHSIIVCVCLCVYGCLFAHTRTHRFPIRTAETASGNAVLALLLPAVKEFHLPAFHISALIKEDFS